MENFKTIPTFPDYEVSNFGRVITKSRQIRYTHAVTGKEHFRQTESKFLKVQCNNFTGYKFYQLYKNKKMFNRPIHSLVADAFLPKIEGKNYINHIDGNKHNNRIENLERCTNEYNHEHATKTGLKAKGSEIGSSVLNEKSVSAIRKLLSQYQWSHSEIAKLFSVSRATISLIAENKTWKHASP